MLYQPEKRRALKILQNSISKYLKTGGKLEPSKEVEIVKIEEGKEFKIGKNIGEKNKIISLLKHNLDIFAWQEKDLSGIKRELIEHKLDLDPKVKPIKQKLRTLGPEKKEAALLEINKFLENGFIREVKYPRWLANIVMVKKALGEWRICIDFTSLNKFCPKYSYPLPLIDQLIDTSTGYKLLSFLDAHSGYNQISLTKSYEEKTSFISEIGTFCYTRMPFGLKNAGATFQRLIDKIFKSQVGRNVEVYVDDILVKSEIEENHIADLEETFSNLKKSGIKLKPSKCTFGIKEGKFLGYMISQKGIKPNPEKIEAVRKLEIPKNIKELQVIL